MSFTSDIKIELTKAPGGCANCKLAECLGVLLYSNKMAVDGIRVVIRSSAVRRHVMDLFHDVFGFPPAETEDGAIQIRQPYNVGRVFDTFGFEKKNGSISLNFGLLEEDCCKLAFFRGAFLAGGSVSAGSGGYHFELVTAHFSITKQANYLMTDMGYPMAMTNRRGNYLLYSKDSAVIEDFLSALGATNAAMDLMLAKVEREMSNNINRKVNCDVANLNKTVEAAARQVEAIQRLQRSGKLDKLSAPLRETANLRLNHPEMSLSELLPLFSEPVSRPGLNNRLRKLVQLASEEEV
jgi:DNA-binding protein WhiA